MSGKDFGKQRIVVLFGYGRRLSVHDLINRAFVSERKAKSVIRELRKGKEIRICDWDRLGTRGRHTPIYERGSEPDVPSPTPLTEAERTRRYRENIRKDMDRVDRMLDIRRTKSRARPVDALANQLFPWLYGREAPATEAAKSEISQSNSLSSGTCESCNAVDSEEGAAESA